MVVIEILLYEYLCTRHDGAAQWTTCYRSTRTTRRWMTSAWNKTMSQTPKCDPTRPVPPWRTVVSRWLVASRVVLVFRKICHAESRDEGRMPGGYRFYNCQSSSNDMHKSALFLVSDHHRQVYLPCASKPSQLSISTVLWALKWFGGTDRVKCVGSKKKICLTSEISQSG